MSGVKESKETVIGIKNKVREIIGPHATPDKIQFTPVLPKTRSGKIMRRILRSIAKRRIRKTRGFINSVRSINC